MNVRVLRVAGSAWLALTGLALAACSGGVSNTETSGSGGGASTNFTIGGTVSGLAGSGLVLQNNGGDSLTVTASGSFAFPTTLITGDSYNISVLSQPSTPFQTCAVTGGSGIVSSADITSVAVVCVDKTTATDTIGGFATGLAGSGLVLQNDGGDNLTVSADGSFTFPTPLSPGLPYNVTILSPPINPYQNCVVASGSGTTGGDNVTNVSVSCKTNASPTYTIGGTITGVSATSPIVLQDNGRDNLTLSANGPFQFPIAIPSGSTYNVTSLAVSGSQSQTCTFTNASGTVANANVANVSIVCKSNATVSVNVTGLKGSGLVLQDNGTDNLTINQNGLMVFPAALVTGATYSITILTQPSYPTQACVVTNGSGIVSAGTTPPATVSCTTNSYAVGGTVTGLAGTGLTVQDNGGARYALTANGSFTLPGVLASGTTYLVIVASQPTNVSQTCTATNASGTVGGANVANVTITCVTQTFTVGGTVGGLAGTGLTVQDNGGASYALTANGPFTIPGTVASGAMYNVMVSAQPTNPTQVCTVTGGGAGTVGGSNVTTVAVNCVTQNFTVGGTLTNLAGTGLTVRDNTGAAYALTANGAFTIPGTIASGAMYNVSVVAQPTNPTQVCTVTGGGTGTVGGSNVTTVAVNCVTQDYTVGGNVVGLVGTGLALKDNNGNAYVITANVPPSSVPFTIPGTVASGAMYNVAVSAQPTNPSQTCTATNNTGTVTTGNITTVTVTCVTQGFTVGGTVSGLNGTGLTVQDNNGAAYALTANGPFTIPGAIASGATYNVAALGQPTNLTQVCTATNNMGTVGAGPVTTVTVTCITQYFTVSGTVSGLESTDTITLGNAGNEMRITGNPPTAVPFTFPAQLSGSAYNVTVDAMPNGDTCVVANAAGTVTNADVTNVAVTCGVIDAYLYITNSADGTISSYGMDENFGGLLPLPGGVVATGTQRPVSIVQGCGTNDDTQPSLFIANQGSSSISAYAVSYANGALTSIGTPFSTSPSTGPVFLDYGECALFTLYGASNSVSSFSDDEGTLTSVSNPVALGANTNPVASTNLTVSPDPPAAASSTSEYVVDSTAGNVVQLVLNTTTGALAAPSNSVSTGTGPDAIASAAVRLDGTPSEALEYFIYVANSGSDSITEFVVDKGDGTLSPLLYNNVVQTVTTGATPSALASAYFYLTSQPQVFVYYLYVANEGDGTISGYSIVPGTIASCQVACQYGGYLSQILVGGANGPQNISSGGTGPVSLSVWQLGSDEGFLYVLNKQSNTVTIFSIDPPTGILTQVGSPVPTGASPTSATIIPFPDD